MLGLRNACYRFLVGAGRHSTRIQNSPIQNPKSQILHVLAWILDFGFVTIYCTVVLRLFHPSFRVSDFGFILLVLFAF